MPFIRQLIASGVLGGGGLSFADNFDRANGAIGGSWTGATWAIVSNKAVNTPTLVAEILANPGFEGVYQDETAPNGWLVVAPNWSQVGCETDGTDLLAESATVHGGSASQQINVNAAYEGVITDANSFSSPNWYQAIVWLYGTAGSAVIDDGGGGGLSKEITPPAGSWTQYLYTFRALASTKFRLRSYLGGANFLADDASNKQITLATMFASQEFGKSSVAASVNLVISSGTQAGLILNLDSAASPANFVMAYHNGATAVLLKCVAGTYTSVISAEAAYSASAALRVIKSGTSYSLYYNGAQVGTTQTISDAGIINNTRHGMMSTYSGNTLDNFQVTG